MPKKKKHGPRYKIPRKPGAYVKRDRLGRFKEWTDWRRGTLIDATRKAESATTPGYGHRKDYDGKKRKKAKAVGFFTRGKGKGRKVIPITPSSKRKKRKIVRVKKKAKKTKATKKKPTKKEKPKKKEAGKEATEKPKRKRKSTLKIPRKKRRRPRKMTYIERMHLKAACKKFGVDPQEIDESITYYENKKHIQDLARMKGYTQAEITSEKQEREEWTQQYEQYLSNLQGELEDAGYTVTPPTM